MYLNTLQPAEGAKQSRLRLGRGIGSGLGKTSGRGHKGQKARSGGYHKVGFEGGQMPLYRRVPKIGFVSRKSLRSENLKVTELNAHPEGEVTLQSLKNAGLIRKDTKFVKFYGTGELSSAYELNGIKASAGAVEAIQAAGGKQIEANHA